MNKLFVITVISLFIAAPVVYAQHAGPANPNSQYDDERGNDGGANSNTQPVNAQPVNENQSEQPAKKRPSQNGTPVNTSVPDQTRQGPPFDQLPRQARNNGEQPSNKAGMPGQNRRGPPNVSAHLQAIQERLAAKNVTPPGLEQAQKQVPTGEKIQRDIRALTQASNLTSIGKEVQNITAEMNRSAMQASQARARIARRSGFVKVLIGGRIGAARALEQSSEENLERIQKLESLLADCQDCPTEVKAFMKQRIQELRAKQQRWQELAQREQRRKGLIGWLWK